MRILMLCFLLLACISQAAGQSDPPNILLIIADDMGIDVLNGYGISGNKPITPHLDSLRESGINFTNCWAAPQCTPTRAAIMSGKLGIKTGVMVPPGPLDIEHTSIFNRVKADPEINYNMSVIGKWHLAGGGNNLDQPAEHGVDHYEGLYSSGVEDYYEWTKVTNGESETVTEYTTSHLTDAAIDWIDQQDNPWFLWLAHAAPHSPLQAPPDGLYTTEPENTRTTYYSMIEAMDHEIGRLIDNIAPSELENTVIFFIGDNGTPGNTSPFYPRDHGKSSIYEGGVRVPFFVTGNGVSRSGTDEEALVHAADLHSTILNLMGMEFEGGINNSLNLTPLFAEGGSIARTINYIDYEDDGLLVWATRTEQYKLIENENGDQEFYDISNDLLEENNLIDELTTDQQAIKEMLETEARIIRTDWSCNDGILNGSETSIDQCDQVLSSELENSKVLTVFPNPSHGTFQVVTPMNQPSTLSLYSIDGRLISRTQGAGSIQFSQIPQGTYVLKMRCNNKVESSKLIVRK